MPISGVLERIESNLGMMTVSEAKIGRWILDHPEMVLHLTVRDLAQRSHSSHSAVMRLCRTLEVESYSALKVLLTADLVRQERTEPEEYSEIASQASFESQLQMFAQAAEHSVRETLNHLNVQDLDVVFGRLEKARNILVFGVAASYVTAEDVTQKLTRLGYPVACWRDVHLTMMAAALLTEDDVAILVSFSGNTREVVELAEQLRQRHVFVVALTQFRPKNPLSQFASLTLHVSAKEPTPRIGATTSVIASLSVVDALLLWLANRNKETTRQYMQVTDEAIRPRRIENTTPPFQKASWEDSSLEKS